MTRAAIIVMGVLAHSAFAASPTRDPLPTTLPAAAPDLPAMQRIEVFPSAIALQGGHDSQSFVVRGVDATGVTHDLTADASFSIADVKLAGLLGRAVVPVADGQTILTVLWQSHRVDVPIIVSSAASRRPVGFRLDVLPALTKSGCNNGACHGSARGQDGFHLSLFGYDPAGDYRTVTRETPGRRLNPALPEESLMLLKAVGGAPHTGGKLFERSDARYKTIVEWLAAGSPADPADVPVVIGLEVFPQDIVLGGVGRSQSLVVRAAYSDGADRDVTTLATFISNNDFAVTASSEGAIRAAHAGEALVMARFDALTVGTAVIVVPLETHPRETLAPADSALPGNYVDEHIGRKLAKMRLAPSGLCSDETFLRRATIDLIGLLPTPAEYERFLSDPAPNKRAQLVDELMTRKEFTELWVMKWAERLGIRSTLEVSQKAMLLYHGWLSERLAAGTPINLIVRDILAANGGTFTNPATNFYQLETDVLKLTENVAQAFLGMRIQCAQCHNHPFDRWTMDDYYGFAAFFSQVGRKGGEDPREMIIFNGGGGDMKHPVGGRVMAPKFLGGPVADVAGKDRRAVLADWLTAKENRMFARNVANFTWAHFFGRGIIEPADDLRVSNPPSNGPLLEALADRLIAYEFDHRRLVRDLCTSQAYQRAAEPNATNATDLSNFSRMQVRRIRAESLLDAVAQVTETKNKFGGLPLGARAAQIPDGNTSDYFLSTFGRSTRATVCTCEVRMEPNLSQALHLLNGETTHKRIHQGAIVAKLIEQGRTPTQIIDQLYVACLSRRPTDAERAGLLAQLPPVDPTRPDAKPDAAALRAALEDVFWAILNSREFMFNH